MSNYKDLEAKANIMRKDIVNMLYQSQSGHPGGSLSACEIVATLFFKEMKLDPKNPQWENRDRFVLSKGHGAPVLYAALAERDIFQKEELKSLRKTGAMLQGHPDMK